MSGYLLYLSEVKPLLLGGRTAELNALSAGCLAGRLLVSVQSSLKVVLQTHMFHHMLYFQADTYT